MHERESYKHERERAKHEPSIKERAKHPICETETELSTREGYS